MKEITEVVNERKCKKKERKRIIEEEHERQ